MNRKISIRREFAERRELQLEEAQNSRRSANSRWPKFASVHGALRINLVLAMAKLVINFLSVLLQGLECTIIILN